LPLGNELQSFILPVDARIAYFISAFVTYYSGEAVTSHLRLKNTVKGLWTFWVSYSVHDQAGEWYDITSHSVTLDKRGITAPK